MQVLFIILAVVALLLWGLKTLRQQKPRATRQSTPALQTVVLPTKVDQEPEASPGISSDVQFRTRGERGMGGAIYGDVLCSDGVYLPKVWEADFHTSFDGRWIRTGSYGDSVPRLLDRQSRRSWRLSVAEAAEVDDLHWKLPRWGGSSARSNGVAAVNGQVMTDNVFEAWLAKNVSADAQALAGVCDLWVPADCLPDAAHSAPPEIAHHQDAVVHVTVQRHWPASLRDLEHPLEPLLQPHWQLYLNGESNEWTIDGRTPLVWRADGQAFACYGFPVSAQCRKQGVRLGVWSLQFGGQQWSSWLPSDHKPWEVTLYAPEDAATSPAALSWDGDELLQRMCIDTPQLERLHDGRSLHCVNNPLYAVSKHRDDGRVLLKKIPVRHFYWRRDLHQPTRWVAQSVAVAGQPLIWTLAQEAVDGVGSTAAYTLKWGGQQLPGLWELEHLVVDGSYALVLPSATSPLQAGKPAPWVWDGKQLNAMHTNVPVLRLRPHVRPASAQLLTVVGCGPDNSNLSGSGLWRWPLQIADATNLVKNGWTPAYEWRDAAIDQKGKWQLLPRWREVQSTQHPCADGDYVWRNALADDAIWWWGGLNHSMDNTWKPRAPRCEGVLVSRAGSVLCGVGPSVCAHHAGDGWLVLEWLARGQDGEAHHWKLHWLRPAKHEVWTLELRADMPLLLGWDALEGVQWRDEGTAMAVVSVGAGVPPDDVHVIAPMRWESAQLEVLKSTSCGLWMRKQDAVYADAITLRDDWPWGQPSLAEKTED